MRWELLIPVRVGRWDGAIALAAHEPGATALHSMVGSWGRWGRRRSAGIGMPAWLHAEALPPPRGPCHFTNRFRRATPPSSPGQPSAPSGLYRKRQTACFRSGGCADHPTAPRTEEAAAWPLSGGGAGDVGFGVGDGGGSHRDGSVLASIRYLILLPDAMLGIPRLTASMVDSRTDMDVLVPLGR